MLTDKQVNELQKMKPSWSHEYIREKDAEWDAHVRRIRNSGADLSQIPIVPGTTEYKKGGSR